MKITDERVDDRVVVHLSIDELDVIVEAFDHVAEANGGCLNWIAFKLVDGFRSVRTREKIWRGENLSVGEMLTEDFMRQVIKA